MLVGASGCSLLGPPATVNAPPPPECQQLIDQCGPLASEGGVSAADDCVRLAYEEASTAQYCFERQSACAAACGGASDASADP